MMHAQESGAHIISWKLYFITFVKSWCKTENVKFIFKGLKVIDFKQCLKYIVFGIKWKEI